MHFISKGINHLVGVIKRGYGPWEISSQNGLFQKLDARIKVLFLFFLIIVVSLKKELLSEIYIWIFIFVLACLSRLSLVAFYKRVLFLGFIFGFLVALPSAFNVITRGEMFLPIVRLSKPYSFWIYHLPTEIGITKEGIYGVALLTLRVINSLSLSFLVLFTTPFPEMVRALRVLKIPDRFLIVITLCYKYIFIFLKTVEEMHLGKKSRRMRELSRGEARRWAVGRIAFIFGKTRRRSEEIFQAMVSRGFSDSIKICGLSKLGPRDWLAGLSLLLIGTLLLWL